jgi:hypothetical protein
MASAKVTVGPSVEWRAPYVAAWRAAL